MFSRDFYEGLFTKKDKVLDRSVGRLHLHSVDSGSGKGKRQMELLAGKGQANKTDNGIPNLMHSLTPDSPPLVANTCT